MEQLAEKTIKVLATLWFLVAVLVAVTLGVLAAPFCIWQKVVEKSYDWLQEYT